MQSTSAVDTASVVAFTKVLAILARTYEIDLPPESRKYLIVQYKLALPFLDRFSIEQQGFKALVQRIVNGYSPTDDDAIHEQFKDLALDLRTLKNEIHDELDITLGDIRFVNDFITAVLSGSEPALKRIHSNVSSFKDPLVNKLFVSKVNHGRQQAKDIARRKEIALKLTGDQNHIITTEEKKKIRKKNATNEALIKEYTKTVTKINAAPKEILKSMVRDSGKQYLLVSDVIRECKRQKVVTTLPHAFPGFIGDDGSFYTKDGMAVSGVIQEQVVMNKDYDPKTDNTYICKHTSATAKDWSSVYSVPYKRAAKKRKFKAIRSMSKNLYSFRKKWHALLKQGLKTREHFLAFMAELAYQTSGRIGGVGNKTDGKTTFGLSTLLGKHAKVKGATIELKYRGKKNILQTHILDPRESAIHKFVYKVVLARMKTTGPKERLLTYNDKITTSTEMKVFLVSRIGIPSTLGVHSFRTARGTGMALTNLAPNKWPKSWSKKKPTKKEIMDFFTLAITPIAKKLGHFTNGNVTINTAIQNYIDPTILEDFFYRVGIRPSDTIQKVIDLANKD